MFGGIMRLRTKVTASLAAVTLATLGVVAPSAYAAGPGTPCSASGQTSPYEGPPSQTPEGACSATGTVTITGVWALATDFTTFTIGTSGQPAAGTNIGDVYVQSNDASTGYSITQSATPFTSGANSIPDSAVDAGYYGPTRPSTPSYNDLGAIQGVANAGVWALSPATEGVTGGINYQCATPTTGWDCYGVPAFYLNTSQGAYPPGTYTGTVTYDLWSN